MTTPNRPEFDNFIGTRQIDKEHKEDLYSAFIAGQLSCYHAGEDAKEWKGEAEGYREVAKVLREAVASLLTTKHGTNPHEAHCSNFRSWPEMIDCDCIVLWATNLLKKTDAT